MPAPAGASESNWLAIFLDVRDDEHLRVAREVELERFHDVERAEAAGEGHVLSRSHADVAEQKQTVLGPRFLDAGGSARVQRTRQIDA